MKSSGHIQKRVSDADFLIANERYEAALLLLLTAIDGSASKIFPPKTLSISNPTRMRKGKEVTNEMPNSEKYQRFLGVRLRQIMGSTLSEEAYRQKELPSIIKGHEQPEVIIYRHFRCNDVHESLIPEKYQYVYYDKASIGEVSLRFEHGEVFFSMGFLTLLKNVIVYAPCNGIEFGVKHLRFKNRDGSPECDFFAYYGEHYEIPPGRVLGIREAILKIGESVYSMDDNMLAEKVGKNIEKVFETGLKYSFNKEAIMGGDGVLTPYGVSIVKDMLDRVVIVDIAS